MASHLVFDIFRSEKIYLNNLSYLLSGHYCFLCWWHWRYTPAYSFPTADWNRMKNTCETTGCKYFNFKSSFSSIEWNTSFVYRNLDIWLIRILVQNGLAFYATWVTIASDLNFVMYIVYRLGANSENAATAALVLLFLIVLVYFVLENFVWQKYLEFTISPYIVLVVAFIGILFKNWQADNPTRNNIFSLTIAIIIAIFFVMKLVLILMRKFNQGLFCFT